MTNVIGLRGAVPQGEPCEDVVLMLEELLKRARGGEIRGIAFAYALPEGIGGSSWSVSTESRNTVAAAILMLNTRYANQMLGD